MTETKSQAYIQVQDYTGNWVKVGSTINSDQLIFRAIQSAKQTYKGKLVRAVDKNGNILQMQ